MIPVALQPEPDDFEEKVRQPGHAWLSQNGIARDQPPPSPSALPNYWTASNKQLWEAYSGVCAYLAIFFEWATGAASTDHFIAKSRNAGDAYEWGNYRLSCLDANRKKNRFDDVLDPVGLAPNTFIINFASGEILPNPSLDADTLTAAIKTIQRLKLDSPENNEMRARRFQSYISNECSLAHTRKESPFIYAEIIRQGLV